MKKIEKQKGHKRGSVLCLCVTLVVLLTIMGLGLLRLGLSARLLAVRNIAQIAARTAADAGHAMAYFKLKQMLDEGSDELPQQQTAVTLPGSNQSYTFTVTDAGSGAYDVTAVGTSAPTQKTVNSRAAPRGPFEGPLFISDSLGISQGSVDGYNSDDGPYGTGNKNKPIDIGTNSDTPGSIDGGGISDGSHITVGPGAADDPESVVSGNFNGTVTAASEERVFPPVSLPTQGLTEGGTLSSGTLTEGRYWFEKIQIDQSTITIIGHVTLCVSGEVEIDQGNLKIQDDGNSSLDLYVGEKVVIDQGSLNADTKDPSLARIFGTPTCLTVTMDQNPTAYAVFYTPSALLELDQGNLYGAFIGQRASIDQGKFHGDEATKNMGGNLPGSRLVTTRWSEN